MSLVVANVTCEQLIWPKGDALPHLHLLSSPCTEQRPHVCDPCMAIVAAGLLSALCPRLHVASDRQLTNAIVVKDNSERPDLCRQESEDFMVQDE